MKIINLTTLALPFLHTSLNLSYMHAMAVGQSLVIVVDLCLTNHTNFLLFHFQKGNLGKKWFVGEASKFHGLVNGLGYIILKMKMLCCAILVLMLIQKKPSVVPNLDIAFISKGYRNWKDASTKFNIDS